nr:MAG TPA: Blasticidin M [Caudoviricetes sp.]
MKIVFISTPNNSEKDINLIKNLVTKYYGRVRFIASSNNDNFDESDCLEMLSTVDMAFFALDWQLSERCIFEHSICKTLGIEIIRE